MVVEEDFANFTILILLFRSNRSFSTYLIKLYGARAERNIFSSATRRKVKKPPNFQRLDANSEGLETKNSR